MSIQLEMCVDSLSSATRAWSAGAHRLEVCENIAADGVTPNVDLVRDIKTAVSIPVYVLIRCRPGNFQYTASEVEQMINDIQMMKSLEVDGFVFGALDKDNNVDIPVCRQLIDAAVGIPVVFHRAFDQVANPSQALEDIIELGFERILTTGGPRSDALTGSQKIRDLSEQAGSRISIMPGGGVTDSNILKILQVTKATDIHSSGRIADPDSPTSKSKFCSEKVIQNMRNVIDHFVL